jgi:hypothetical protein
LILAHYSGGGLVVSADDQPEVGSLRVRRQSPAPQAQASAIKCQADGVLVQKIRIRKNGGHCGEVELSLPLASGKKGIQVDVKESKIEQTLEVSWSFTDAVDGNFVGSPQAMAEAKKKGLKGKLRAMLPLHVMLQGTKSEGPYWNIVSDQAEGRSTLINAKTGKFFRHQALK